MTEKRYNFAPPGKMPLAGGDTSPAFAAEALPDGVHAINRRISHYRREGLTRKITPCTKDDLDTGALAADPYYTDYAEGTNMVKVKDTGALLTEPQEVEAARAYFRAQGHTPSVWAAYLATGSHPPYLFERTSFIHYFGENIVALIDIYRPPWKNFYTSDAFFSQWLRALQKSEVVQNLPDAFPKTLYINNITNPITKKELKQMLNDAGTDILSKVPHRLMRWHTLKNTPHIKCVLNILNDYNQVKSLPPHHGYRIENIQLYREEGVYHLKMRVGRPASRSVATRLK